MNTCQQKSQELEHVDDFPALDIFSKDCDQYAYGKDDQGCFSTHAEKSGQSAESGDENLPVVDL